MADGEVEVGKELEGRAERLFIVLYAGSSPCLNRVKQGQNL